MQLGILAHYLQCVTQEIHKGQTFVWRVCWRSRFLFIRKHSKRKIPITCDLQLKVWPSPHSAQTAAFLVLASNGWYVKNTKANPTLIPMEAFVWDYTSKMNVYLLRFLFLTLVVSRNAPPPRASSDLLLHVSTFTACCLDIQRLVQLFSCEMWIDLF